MPSASTPAAVLLPLAAAVAVIALQLQPSHAAAASVPSGAPDEAALRAIFLGRCDEFQLVLHPELFANQLKNCSRLWDSFRDAALSPASCPTDPRNFEKLMQLADHMIPANSSIFWSGVMELMAKLQELESYFSIEKTLMGYTMNSLDWCNRNCTTSVADSPMSDELPKDQMQDWLPVVSDEWVKTSTEMCNNVTLTFWIAASKWYASRAVGRAFVILNASVETPFRETSIFGQYELPRISPSSVTSMDILLVHSLRDPRTSGACRHSSVQNLQSLLTAKGIPARCTENPSFLVHILCADQPDADRCRLIGGSTPGGPRPSSGWIFASSAFAVLFAGSISGEAFHKPSLNVFGR